MKIKVVKNKYINAVLVLMLFSAAVHMIILFYLAITLRSLDFLNYFNILNINYLIPGFLNGLWGNIMSIIFALSMYLIILYINKVE